MAETRKCRACGTEVQPNAPFGHCPKCLLELGFGAPSEEPIKDSTPGTKIRYFGDYELLEQIGRGGMGVVYKARQLSLNRMVALKMITSGELASPAVVQRFQIEAEATARLDHPGIVPIFEVGVHEGQHYFAMKLVEGSSLDDVIRNDEFRVASGNSAANKSTSHQQQLSVARLIVTVGRSVHYAHQHGVLHRDLKPSNIIVDREGQPHLTDFGLAKILEHEVGITPNSAVMGTPGYMSPEQAQGQSLATSTDIYSLGAILYQMLTGRPPFCGSTALEILQLVREGEPVDPRSFNTHVDRDLATICLKCLANDPLGRYSSAGLLADDLENWQAGRPILARPVGTSEKIWRWCCRKPAVAVLGGATVLLLLALLIGSPLAAIRINNARKLADRNASAEARQRARAEDTAARIELQAAEDLFAGDNAALGVAHLARLLRNQPTNRVAAERLISALSQRQFLLPIGEPLEHEPGPASARFSTDGRRALLIARQTARVWDADTAKPLIRPIPHGGHDVAKEFSPDGKWLLAAAHEEDGSFGITAWDCTVSNAEPVRSLMQHDKPVLSIAFSPDGAFVATGSSNGVARVWRVGAWTPVTGPLTHDGRADHVLFSPDGERLITGSSLESECRAQAWDPRTGESVSPPLRVRLEVSAGPGQIESILRLFAAGLPLLSGTNELLPSQTMLSEAIRDGVMPGEAAKGGITHLEVSPDGSAIATWSVLGIASFWNPENGQLVGGPIRRGVGEHLHFSEDSQRLLVASSGSARIYDPRTGVPLSEFLPRQLGLPSKWGYKSSLHTARFSPDGRRIITASEDNVRLWEGTPRARPAVILEPSTSGEYGVQFSRDGQRAITRWGQLRIADAFSGSTLLKSPENKRFDSVEESPDGRLLMTRYGNELRVCEAETLRPICQLTNQPRGREVVFSSDGTELISWSIDGVERWNIRTGKPVGKPLKCWNGSPAFGSRLSPHGERLLITATASENIVDIWDTRTGQRIGDPLIHPERLSGGVPQFNRDATLLVTFSGKEARVWEVSSGRLLHGPLRHLGEILLAEFSPDRQWLATASHDNTVRVWNLRAGQPVPNPLQATRMLTSVQFSPDSRRLLAGSRVWDVETGFPLSEPLLTLSRFSRSGQQVLTDGTFGESSDILDARLLLWDVYLPPLPVPYWFASMAEAIVGQRLTEAGIAEPVSAAEIQHWRHEAGARLANDFYSRWMKWFFVDSPERTIAFNASLTQADYVERLAKTPFAQKDLRVALELAPTNLLAITQLAKHYLPISYRGFAQSTQALLTAISHTRRAIALAPNELALWRLWTDELLLNSDEAARIKQSVRMCEAYPNNPGPWLAKGVLLGRSLRPDTSDWDIFPDGRRLLLSGYSPSDESQRAFAEGIKRALTSPNEHQAILLRLRLRRSEALYQLSRRSEATEEILVALGIGPRKASAQSNAIDLSGLYNGPAPLDPAQWRTGHPSARMPPPIGKGIETLAGVDFDVRGVIHLVQDPFESLNYSSAPLRRISIERKCRGFHFLHACLKKARAGTEIGVYRVHYEGGKEESLSIVYGVHISQWQDKPQAQDSAVIAWRGRDDLGQSVRLFKTSWPNPHPDLLVHSIDFVPKEPESEPFLVAITADGPSPIDLDPYFNSALARNWYGDILEAVPKGMQIFGGTAFNVRSGIQISLAKPRFPKKVTGIVVEQTCRRLQFLHGAIGHGQDGRQVGKYVIHFKNGEQFEIPIVIGKENEGWPPDGIQSSFAIGWGENAKSRGIRLFKSTWENAEPDVAISTMDFVATDSDVSPFLMAVTPE